MEEILSIKKSEVKAYPLATVVDIFKSTDDLDVINQYVENAEDRMYVSWASVDAVDKAKEKIPIQDVITQQEILLKRGGPISNEHTNAIVGKTHAYKVLMHPVTKTIGVLHLNQIYKDNTKDDEVWKDIQDKKKTGSSVAGTHNPSQSYNIVDKEGEGFVKVLSGFGQYETAVTEKPCNPYATIESNSVIAKSEEKMEKTETKKEDPVNVDSPVAAPEAQDEFKNTVMASIAKIGERLDAIEEKISGGASDEEPVEESKSAKSELDEIAPQKKPQEEKKPEDEKKPEEEKKPEDDTEKKALKKELEDAKKSIEELKKTQVVEVIKSERPNQPEVKTESQDFMKSVDDKIEEMKKSGNYSFKELGAEIRKAQSKELQKKFN